MHLKVVSENSRQNRASVLILFRVDVSHSVLVTAKSLPNKKPEKLRQFLPLNEALKEQEEEEDSDSNSNSSF